MAAALLANKAKTAWVINGSDGLDEITTTGPTFVASIFDGDLRSFEITPEDAGLPRATPDDLKGGDPEYNAAAMTALFDGAPGPYRDIVLINAAAAFIVAGKDADLKSGAARAADRNRFRRRKRNAQTPRYHFPTDSPDERHPETDRRLQA